MTLPLKLMHKMRRAHRSLIFTICICACMMGSLQLYWTYKSPSHTDMRSGLKMEHTEGKSLVAVNKSDTVLQTLPNTRSARMISYPIQNKKESQTRDVNTARNISYPVTWLPSGVIYNRVPKCGSVTFGNLISQLQSSNKFSLLISADYVNERISVQQQRQFAESLTARSKPFVYNRHIQFVDFSSFGLPTPMYINLVRNPLDRFLSHYLYHQQLYKQRLLSSYMHVKLPVNDCVRINGSDCFKEAQIKLLQYFCGQDKICMSPSVSALELAKRNIDRYYTVVGTIEEFKQFLKLLACALPKFFHGIHHWYLERPFRRNASKYKDTLTQGSKDILTRTMALEIELYYFIKRKAADLEQKYSKCLTKAI